MRKFRPYCEFPYSYLVLPDWKNTLRVCLTSVNYVAHSHAEICCWKTFIWNLFKSFAAPRNTTAARHGLRQSTMRTFHARGSRAYRPREPRKRHSPAFSAAPAARSRGNRYCGVLSWFSEAVREVLEYFSVSWSHKALKQASGECLSSSSRFLNVNVLHKWHTLSASCQSGVFNF